MGESIATIRKIHYRHLELNRIDAQVPLSHQ